MPSTINIRNMVCERCVRAVRQDLSSLGYGVKSVTLGEAVLEETLEKPDLEKIAQILSDDGFELIDDRKSMLINRIKTIIIEYVHHDRERPGHVNLSDMLSREIGYDYSYLSSLFSSVEGKTIEKFLILQKTEKVKELLVYNQLSLSEIAYKLDYSSVQHLSQQFKKITGLTPSHFRKIKDTRRKPLDTL